MFYLPENSWSICEVDFRGSCRLRGGHANGSPARDAVTACKSPQNTSWCFDWVSVGTITSLTASQKKRKLRNLEIQLKSDRFWIFFNCWFLSDARVFDNHFSSVAFFGFLSPPFRDRGTRGGKKPRLIFLRNREIRRGTPGWVKIPELKWCTTTQWNVSWKYRELIFLLLLIFLGDECRHELSAEDDETLIESSIGLISQNCVQVFVVKFDWMFYRFTSKITNHPCASGMSFSRKTWLHD